MVPKTNFRDAKTAVAQQSVIHKEFSFEMASNNSIRIGSERPRFFEAFGVGIVMVRANLHILALRILDLALNPALQ
jgi:hypothetical protein